MDDTTTITPEERARLRELADKSYLLPLDEGEVPSVGFDGLTDDRIAYIAAACNSVPLLLDALEQAEARAEKAEKELAGADAEIAELRDELEDSRGTEKDAPNILCAIARLVGVYEHSQEIGDDMGEMTLDAVRDLLADKQTAEANVARTTKELDWLANKLIYCPPEFTNCALDCAECRKEAARRAVAAGEG